MGDFSTPLWMVTGMIGFVLGIITTVWAQKHIKDPVPPTEEIMQDEGHYQ